MKRLFTLWLACVVILSLSAGPVSKESAQQKAVQFFNSKYALARGKHKIELALASNTYYVFNIESDKGFVIVSGDDSTPDILGYSLSGSFDSQNMPDNMRSFLKSYRDQIEAIQSHRANPVPRQTVEGDAISPLLEGINYDQGDPYNQMCPDGKAIVNGVETTKKCVTGCVSTAMAQVLRYYCYPSQTTAVIPAYREVSEYDLTTIDWPNVLPTYTGSESQEQKDAVATLFALCGASVKMVYGTGSSSSSSSSVPDALITYFGFGSGVKNIKRNNYRAAKWNQLIYNELNAGRPVIYSGQSSGGGHSFIVDGYSSDDYFHVNWGWSGYQDNYFLLSVVDPGASSGIGSSSSSDGYSFAQDAVVGIAPDYAGDDVPTPVVMSTNEILSGNTTEFTRGGSSEDFSFSVYFSAWNWTGKTNTFDLGVGIYDQDENLLKSYISKSDKTYDPNFGVNKNECELSFGANLPDGYYIIAGISRLSGQDKWSKNNLSDANSLVAVISGNTLTLKSPDEAYDFSDVSLVPVGKTEVGSLLPLELTVRNNGLFFNKEVFLYVNGRKMGGKYLEIPTGEVAMMNIGFVPTAKGEYDVKISYEDGKKQNVEIASALVTVNDAPKADLSIKTSVNSTPGMIIEDSKMIVALEITNMGSETYDNIIKVELYKLRDDGSNIGDAIISKQQEILLEPSQTTNVEFVFDKLLDGASYFYSVSYFSQGVEMMGLSFSYTIHIPVPDPKMRGDVNGDNKVNGTDIQAVINVITEEEYVKEADVNKDNKVNGTDIQEIINIIVEEE